MHTHTEYSTLTNSSISGSLSSSVAVSVMVKENSLCFGVFSPEVGCAFCVLARVFLRAASVSSRFYFRSIRCSPIAALSGCQLRTDARECECDKQRESVGGGVQFEPKASAVGRDCVEQK